MVRRLALISALALLLVAVGIGQWWRTSPTPVFAGSGATLSMDPTPVGRAASVQIFPNQDRELPVTVRFTAVEPIIRGNTADASVELFVCTPPEGADTLPQIGYAAPDDHVADECATSEPVLGREVTFGPDTLAVLYYRVEPGQAGRVVVNGIHVEYDLGWQRAEQAVGDRLIVRPR